MMLSRVAERLYWMARYLERAEDTARLISEYSHLVLDVPRQVEPGWQVLIDTLDAQSLFARRYRNPSERNVIKFLLAEKANPCSIRYAIGAARENVRTTRDVLPSQAWELVNELYLYVSDVAGDSLSRTPRFGFLEKVMAANQQLNGLLQTSVTRDHTLWFITLGQLVERADMTSRVLDVAIGTIGTQGQGTLSEIPLLWAHLLKSLSATAAYRRQVGPTLNPDEVIEFVLKQRRFPRSIAHCLDGIEETVSMLKAPGGMLHGLRRILQPVDRFAADIDEPARLHRLIDQFQLGLAGLDDDFHETWFARSRQ